jgi:phosphoglycolate phosphatase-like HAD superfamily hydrolase
MDLSIKDALAPLGAVLAGVITGLLAGERRIRAERTAERERRRTELRQRDSSEALDALMAYLTKRPSLASVRDLVELVPPGRPIPELRSLLDELKEAANRLQVLVPDEEDMALVRQDYAAVADWLRHTTGDLQFDGAAEVPTPQPLIDLARRLRRERTGTAVVTPGPPPRRRRALFRGTGG